MHVLKIPVYLKIQFYRPLLNYNFMKSKTFVFLYATAALEQTIIITGANELCFLNQ